MTSYTYDPLIVKLDPELKRRLKVAAARSGTDMSKLTRRAIEEYLDRLEPHRRRGGRGSELVEHLRGRATSNLSTDEIMALTRG
jgi:predicted transcriptional regulator